MTRRPARLLRLTLGAVALCAAVVVVVAGYRIATEPGKVAGCRPPPHEEKLLDRYEADHAIRVGPPGFRGRDPIRTEACVQRTQEDITTTSVLRRWFGTRSYGEAELRRLYDGHGWEPMPAARSGAANALVYLRYCRVVETVVSYLDVLHLDNSAARDDTPYEVHADITASVGERSCPPPGRT